MQDAIYLDDLFAEAIDGHVGQAGEHQLARVGSPPRTPTMRKLREGVYALVDGQRRTPGSSRCVMPVDIVADSGEVANGRVCPANAASAGIPALDELADIFVFDELAPVRSGQALFNLLEKPFVVIHKSPYRLIHQFFGVAALAGGDLAQFGHDIGREVNLHVESLGGCTFSRQAPLATALGSRFSKWGPCP
jgi:hypothetical protein